MGERRSTLREAVVRRLLVLGVVAEVGRPRLSAECVLACRAHHPAVTLECEHPVADKVNAGHTLERRAHIRQHPAGDGRAVRDYRRSYLPSPIRGSAAACLWQRVPASRGLPAPGKYHANTQLIARVLHLQDASSGGAGRNTSLAPVVEPVGSDAGLTAHGENGSRGEEGAAAGDGPERSYSRPFDCGGQAPRTRGAGTWAGRRALLDSSKLVHRILGALPSLHLLLGIAPVCRAWGAAAQRVEQTHGVLDCSPYPLMTDAELLFLVRRFRRRLTRLVLRG
jgi:hypothetical protein